MTVGSLVQLFYTARTLRQHSNMYSFHFISLAFSFFAVRLRPLNPFSHYSEKGNQANVLATSKLQNNWLAMALCLVSAAAGEHRMPSSS